MTQPDSIRDTIAQHLRQQEEAKAAISALEDPLQREIRKLGEWREQFAASLQPTQPKVIDVHGAPHIVDMGREVRRRNAAAEEADQRTVAVLEALLHEAQTTKAGSVKMLKWARIAGWAGIAAVVLTVLLPVVQSLMAKGQ
ncbi:MAG: hypothetical protein EOP24_38120 [Hyphomicrobiales bacterium]|nr:MAG: hypothetical protein EOP24_38120 [Hyphomicrobiales bacterium]